MCVGTGIFYRCLNKRVSIRIRMTMTSIASDTNEAGTARPRALISQKQAFEGPGEASIEAMATPDPSTTSRTESEVEEEGGEHPMDNKNASFPG